MYNAKQGWYRLLHPEKFVLPKDDYMKSYKDGKVQYKSSLELKAFKYADWNPKVKHWSLEPFGIPYLNPLDGKQHRYYIDLVVEFVSGDRFLIEIKSFQETQKPRVPGKKTARAIQNYQERLKTYLVNQSKWKYANKLCESKGYKFTILTENELKI